MKEKTINQGMRFRESELQLAREQATQLGCAAGDIIRAALARTRHKPIKADEIPGVLLKAGIGGMDSETAKRVQSAGSTAAVRAKKRRKREQRQKTSSP